MLLPQVSGKEETQVGIDLLQFHLLMIEIIERFAAIDIDRPDRHARKASTSSRGNTDRGSTAAS